MSAEEQWSRIWTVALLDLRLNEEEFLALTYRRFEALCEYARERRWRAEWQLAAVAAAVCNNGMRRYDPPPTPHDFMFTLPPGVERTQGKAVDHAEVDSAIRAFASNFTPAART